MPRIMGYSDIGKRLFGKRPVNERGRKNIIGAIIDNELIDAFIFDCYINANVFYAWIVALLKKIPDGSVLVMDNAAFHKRPDIIEKIEKNHELLFLPTYSPDLNPIEHKWAQIKAKIREIHCNIEHGVKLFLDRAVL
jgi:transposase